MPMQNPEIEQFKRLKQANRQDLIELIEQDPPFSDSSKVAQCLQACLKLLDASESLFNACQLTTLIQIAAFALNHAVEIQSAATQEDNTTLFETATHSLKIIYKYDEYDTYLTDKETGKMEFNEGLYVEDFGSIMEDIKEQNLNLA